MTTTNSRKATITFNPMIILTPDKRQEVRIDLSEVPATVLGDILIAGTRVLMTNAYNSGGKDTPEADRRRNVERRLAAWKRGEYALTATGPRESIIGEMREAFIAKQVSLGRTVKEADALIRSTVTEAFGKDEKATFPRFLDAVATAKAKATEDGDFETIREELEQAALAAVEAIRKERAAATDEIAIDAADLF